MAELSHRALRELIAGFGGCNEYFSEMISAAGTLGNGPFEEYYRDALPEPEKMVFQLAGRNAEEMEKAAAKLDGLDCKGIDINMGCSAPLILKRGMGAAWLLKKDEAVRMVSRVRSAVKCHRLSVKMRLGETDDYDALLAFCHSLADAGVEMVTLHARTIKEKFKRTVRWEETRRLARDLSIPVTGNGDIDSSSELAEKAASGDFAAVMVGRLAVREPWCFAEAKGEKFTVTSDTLVETALKFFDLLEEYQPPEFQQSRAVRFFRYYCKNFKWGEYLYNKIHNAENMNAIRAILKTEDVEPAGCFSVYS
jgi:tRNA-dihydrouridine synthase